MTKTELLNKLARDDESRLLLARALDKLDTARNRSVPCTTAFLSPAERVTVESLLNASGHPAAVFCGGYEGAERTICAFLPDWMGEEDFVPEEQLCALRCKFTPEADLSHRDFLGSVMGLGITREKIGDILVGDGVCDIVVLRDILPIILAQLDSAGRYKLQCAPLELDGLAPKTSEVKLVRDTFHSLRLDAVAAAGFGLPRTKAASLISGGKMAVNHKDCDKPDRILAEGDTLTCRGLGKCVLARVTGTSKKGRIMVEMERYI
ncbi:MAG: YlmH/Sll1252 family protein [Oscillospiraceae bacterium]